MQVTAIFAPVALLIVVAVIVGLVMLVRALPPGSGPKVALAVAGVIAFGLLFMIVGYQRQQVAVPHARVMYEANPQARAALPAPPAPMIEVRNELSFNLIIGLMVITAVIVGFVVLFRAVPQGSRPKIALGLGVVLALMFAVFFVSKEGQPVPHSAAVRHEPPELRSIRQSSGHEENAGIAVPSPQIDVRNESNLDPTASEPSVKEPEPKSFTSPANETLPKAKPAWLTQGTQTGNGASQFAISSELFSTVAESQKDLDRRMSALIAAEVRYLVGEEYPIALLPGEAQRLVAETYLEEFPITSNGIWYKIHRLIKIDQTTWATFRVRFQQAQLHARLESLGLSFGGLMLAIGVGYLVLRRKPRVVDPTLETFSTT